MGLHDVLMLKGRNTRNTVYEGLTKNLEHIVQVAWAIWHSLTKDRKSS